MPPCTLGCRVLDAAVEHLGETGVFADVDHREAGVAQRLGGAAGGQQFDARRGERAGEVDEAGFIRHGKQGTFNGHDGLVRKAVFAHFLAQGVAVDAEHVGGARLVASARSRM
jgi:hypothetical protein